MRASSSLTRSVLLRSRAAARSRLDGRGAGAGLRLQNLAVQLIAALGQRVLARFLLRNLLDRTVHPLRERGNLLLQTRLVGVHRRHAAGQHHAQLSAQLFAHRGIALRLRRLALQAVHLPRDLFKDVVHARQILFRAFQAQLRQPLLGLEARNAGGLFDNGSALIGLRAQQLPDAFLPDDGVALRSQARAHENVLNVAQPAELAVQQVLAFAGAEQPPRNDHFALLRLAWNLRRRILSSTPWGP